MKKVKKGRVTAPTTSGVIEAPRSAIKGPLQRIEVSSVGTPHCLRGFARLLLDLNDRTPVEGDAA